MLFALIALAIAVYAGYGLWAESRAEAEAREFCASFEIGSTFEDARARAQSVGEPRLKLESETSVTVGFTGLPPFSRHLCRVTRDGNRVAAAEYQHLD